MSLTLYTFGYKYPDWKRKLKEATKTESCMFEDVREFINDPPPKFKGCKLHALSGNDRRLRETILGGYKVQKYLDNLETRLEGHCGYFAFGCTSGRHRSVSVAIEMRDRLKKKGITVTVVNLYL